MVSKSQKTESPLELAERWALVLAQALARPTLDEEGRVCFKTRSLPPPKSRDALSHPVSRCPTAGSDVLYRFSDMESIARCVVDRIREAKP